MFVLSDFFRQAHVAGVAGGKAAAAQVGEALAQGFLLFRRQGEGDDDVRAVLGVLFLGLEIRRNKRKPCASASPT